MKRRTKSLIVLVALAQVVLAVGVFSLPRIVEALPGRVRANSRFPQALSDLAYTPVPTALPAPSEGTEIDVSRIQILSQPTATVAPTDSPTAVVTAAATTAATDAAPTPLPPTFTPEPTPTLPPTPEPVPAQHILTGLENRPQRFNNCGPANMSMVLNFFGNPTTQSDAAAVLKPNPEDRNVSPWQISDYVNQFTDLRSTVHSGGTLAMIERFVAAGLPVVVEKGFDPNTAEGWYGHYLTVYGYDQNAREFLSMDTYLGPWDNSGRIDSYEEMELYWQQFNYTFYVIYRPEQEALVQSILGADLLEPFTMWQNAALRAQREADADPENAYAWFNLGTSLTRLGELTGDASYYADGAIAFDQARSIGLPGRMLWYQFRPYLAYMKTGRYQDMLDLADATLTTSGGRNVEETYLYRGHALAFLNDVAGARAAYQRALELNTNFYPAQWALDSLN